MYRTKPLIDMGLHLKSLDDASSFPFFLGHCTSNERVELLNTETEERGMRCKSEGLRKQVTLRRKGSLLCKVASVISSVFNVIR
jgi:hypothetical protein